MEVMAPHRKIIMQAITLKWMSSFFFISFAALAYCPEVEKDVGDPKIVVILGQGFDETKIFKFTSPIFQEPYAKSFKNTFGANLKSQMLKDGVAPEAADEHIAQLNISLPVRDEFLKELSVNLKDLGDVLKEKCCPLSKMSLGLKIEKRATGNGGSLKPVPVVRQMIIAGCPNNPPESFKGTELERLSRNSCRFNSADVGGDYMTVGDVRDQFRICSMRLEDLPNPDPKKTVNKDSHK